MQCQYCFGLLLQSLINPRLWQPCTIKITQASSASSSSLRYLDILGNEVTYTLKDAQLISQTFITGITKAFVFQFTLGSWSVFVAVPIVDGVSGSPASPNTEIQQTVVVNQATDPIYYGLKNINSDSVTNMSLSTFNMLNDITNGKFYSVMDTTNMATLLIAKIHYQFSRTFNTVSTTKIFDETSFVTSTESSGDVLCWGSQGNYGFVSMIRCSFKHT